MWRHFWELWKVIARVIANVQARLILNLLYFGLVGPVALVRRLVADPLGLRQGPRHTYWTSRPPADVSRDAARRQ
ncbi:MAG: hypothetical protein ACREKF_05265 [Candidatus Methylomirabilales bacterium]